MKTCSNCKRKLDDSQFYKKNKAGTKLQSTCKTCYNDACVKRWKQRKRDAITYMGNACQDCKQSYPDPVYEFHHLDPSQKDMTWNKMRLASKAKRKMELDKCVMLCANCHRIRHMS